MINGGENLRVVKLPIYRNLGLKKEWTKIFFEEPRKFEVNERLSFKDNKKRCIDRFEIDFSLFADWQGIGTRNLRIEAIKFFHSLEQLGKIMNRL